jgi:hypothetical protein
MKVGMSCPDCHGKFHQQFFVELAPKNDCTYEINCPRGHRFRADILYHEFQKLFEVAINALIDGYYREAVGSFTASYERFMELFIRIVAKAHGVDEQTINSTWKSISRQSERQLGAFALLFMLEFKVRPNLLKDKPHIELRNQVVHQGYFPTREQCMAYGEAVLLFIRGAIGRLHHSDKYRDELIRSINDQIGPPTAGVSVHYYAYPLIGTNRPPGDDTKTLEEMLEYTIKVRAL